MRTTPPSVLPRDLGRLELVLGAWHWPEYPSRFVASDRGLGFAYPPREEEPVRDLILMLTEYDLADGA